MIFAELWLQGSWLFLVPNMILHLLYGKYCNAPYMYNDGEGASYALTPSHLIYGRNISMLPSDRHFEIVHMNLWRKELNIKERY